MRIGEFAEVAGLSTRQVRYYTDMGLLAARRLSNGYRDYDAGDVARARRVHALFAIGLTSEQLKRLSPCLADEATTSATPPGRHWCASSRRSTSA